MSNPEIKMATKLHPENRWEQIWHSRFGSCWDDMITFEIEKKFSKFTFRIFVPPRTKCRAWEIVHPPYRTLKKKIYFSFPRKSNHHCRKTELRDTLMDVMIKTSEIINQTKMNQKKWIRQKLIRRNESESRILDQSCIAIIPPIIEF